MSIDSRMDGINYYGIERAYRRARRLQQELDKRQLTNTHLLASDAGFVVENMIPDASVAAYHIYFPDPWWKRRHFRRRYFTPEFARGLERTLLSGGTLFLATDVDEVMERMLEAVTTHTTLVRHPEMRSPRVGLTNFERKGLARGARIHDAVFLRSA